MSKKKPPSRWFLTSKVMRVGGETYSRIGSLKERYAKKNKQSRTTYDAFLTELLEVAELLLDGKEVYLVDGKVFRSLSEAWSWSVQQSVKSKKPVEAPLVLIEAGRDTSFEIPEFK